MSYLSYTHFFTSSFIYFEIYTIKLTGRNTIFVCFSNKSVQWVKSTHREC